MSVDSFISSTVAYIVFEFACFTLSFLASRDGDVDGVVQIVSKPGSY
jgi:hypothetical protein